MSAASNFTKAMKDVSARLFTASLTHDKAIDEADELMRDFIREVGQDEAMDAYGEIRGWEF